MFRLSTKCNFIKFIFTNNSVILHLVMFNLFAACFKLTPTTIAFNKDDEQQTANYGLRLNTADDTLAMLASLEPDSPFIVQRQQQHHHRKQALSQTNLNSINYNETSRQLSALTLNDKQFITQFDWTLSLRNSTLKLAWSYEYSKNLIYFKLIVDKSGDFFAFGRDLLAVGFSERGEFENADFCLFWFDLAKELHLQDASTDSNARLKLGNKSTSVCKLILKSNKSNNLLYNNNNNNYRNKDLSEDFNELRELLSSSSSSSSFEKEAYEFSFTRPLDACDNSHYIIDNGTTHVVWFRARGPLVSIDGLHLNSSMSLNDHNDVMQNNLIEKGMSRVQLIATKIEETNAIATTLVTNSQTNFNKRRISGKKSRFLKAKSGTTKKLSLTMTNYSIPAADTTYACKLLKLPANFERREFHIVKYEALIKPVQNSHVVHHMELFNCALDSSTQRAALESLYASSSSSTDSNDGNGSGSWTGDCNSPNRPPELNACKRVILAWAMGAQPLIYPSNVGQLIGGRLYSPFLLLEVHYNNEAKSGQLMLDSSGLTFEYTSELRQFNAGVLEVGLEYSDKNSIPPAIVAPLAGHCVPECTRVGLLQQSTATTTAVSKQQQQQLSAVSNADEANSNEGIRVFAAQMHTHLTGIASWTEHYRGGKLIGELQRDDHYSPHLQQIRLLPRQVRVLPGDALVHYCVYDTRKRTNITLGGFATSDEMCVTYIHYYPKVELEVCKSSVNDESLFKFFNELSKDFLDNTSGNQSLVSVAQNYKTIQWSPIKTKRLLQLYNEAPLSIQCNKSNGARFPGATWNGITSVKNLFETQQSKRALTDASNARLLNYRGAHFRWRHPNCAL